MKPRVARHKIENDLWAENNNYIILADKFSLGQNILYSLNVSLKFVCLVKHSIDKKGVFVGDNVVDVNNNANVEVGRRIFDVRQIDRVAESVALFTHATKLATATIRNRVSSEAMEKGVLGPYTRTR